MTIEEFCERNRIAMSTYFIMKRRGEGPRTVKIGKRRLISAEAETAWRRERTS